MNKVLIVIDMQNDFINGALGTKEAVSIIPNVKKKIVEYLDRGDEVIFTRDTHYDDYFSTNEGKCLPIEHCKVGTYGWHIHEELDDGSCEHIDKPTFGYRFWDRYTARNFGEIEVVGVCSDICILANCIILKTFFPESHISVDASCCAGTSPQKHAEAMSVLKSCQISVVNENGAL